MAQPLSKRFFTFRVNRFKDGKVANARKGEYQTWCKDIADASDSKVVGDTVTGTNRLYSALLGIILGTYHSFPIK